MQPMKSTEGSYWRRAAVRIAAISSWSMILWGSWAFAANLSYGFEAAARAGLTQGASSLALTSLQTAILEAVSRRCEGPAAKVLAPTLCAVLVHALLTIGAHVASGTPALLTAVAPNIAASVAYSLTYAAGLALAAHPELRILQRVVQISQILRRRPAAIAHASASLSAPVLRLC
jgi:hypothetical protein